MGVGQNGNVLNVLGLSGSPALGEGCGVGSPAHHSLGCGGLFCAGDGSVSGFLVVVVRGADALCSAAAAILCPIVGSLIPNVGVGFSS